MLLIKPGKSDKFTCFKYVIKYKIDDSSDLKLRKL